MLVAGAGLRIPDHHGVLHPISVGKGADHDGSADVHRGIFDNACRFPIRKRADIRGVFRPDNDVRLLFLTLVDTSGQLIGGIGVVLQDCAALGIEL